jgi:hypothetical protein
MSCVSDDSDRDYVPGEVAAIDDSGDVVSVDPREIDDPIVTLAPFSWEDCADFLRTGQWYE